MTREARGALIRRWRAIPRKARDKLFSRKEGVDVYLLARQMGTPV